MTKQRYIGVLIVLLGSASLEPARVQACCYENSPPEQSTPVIDDELPGQDANAPPEQAAEELPEQIKLSGGDVFSDEEETPPLPVFEETALFEAYLRLDSENRHLEALRLVADAAHTHPEQSRLQQMIEAQRLKLGLSEGQGLFLPSEPAGKLSFLMPTSQREEGSDLPLIRDAAPPVTVSGRQPAENTISSYSKILGIFLPLLKRE